MQSLLKYATQKLVSVACEVTGGEDQRPLLWQMVKL